MADSELQVILKAKELAEHTLRVTSNCNNYPKKWRFSLVDKMQNTSLDIWKYLHEANRMDLKSYGRERSELQTQAITHCDALLFYIELSYKLNIINDKSMGYWSKMVADIKHMAIKWRRKDKERQNERLA